jgi:hypothetical protein
VPVSQAEREAGGQQAVGLTPETVHEEIPEQVLRGDVPTVRVFVSWAW